MATNRVIPPTPEQLSAETTAEETKIAQTALKQKKENRLDRAIWAGSVAQVIMGVVVVMAILYLAKLVLVTLLVSILIAFTLEPLVSLLQRLRLPRPAAAFIAVVVLLAACWGASYFFYYRAVEFLQQTPKYTQQIRGAVARFRQQTKNLQQTTENILPDENKPSKNVQTVRIQTSAGSDMISQNLGHVTEVVLTLAFIPFLVYFMLSWQEHARTKTVELFPAENRTTAYVTLGQISVMVRSFIAGNVIIGVFMSIISMIVFGLLGLPYFYFLGIISGFLSLMPYLGIVLAVLPPLAAGLGNVKESGLIILVATVLGLHLFAMNVLYPKVIGRRLQLNPLLVTISLLLWGWLWGAMGLILAVPIMGVLKIVCDNVVALRRFGDWMGDE
jgi:predicted PurR-regulated permease PerM